MTKTLRDSIEHKQIGSSKRRSQGCFLKKEANGTSGSLDRTPFDSRALTAGNLDREIACLGNGPSRSAKQRRVVAVRRAASIAKADIQNRYIADICRRNMASVRPSSAPPCGDRKAALLERIRARESAD